MRSGRPARPKEWRSLTAARLFASSSLCTLASARRAHTTAPAPSISSTGTTQADCLRRQRLSPKPEARPPSLAHLKLRQEQPSGSGPSTGRAHLAAGRPRDGLRGVQICPKRPLVQQRRALIAPLCLLGLHSGRDLRLLLKPPLAAVQLGLRNTGQWGGIGL